MNNKRQENETMEEYHDRLEREKKSLQNYLKGTYIHHSSKEGTYKKN